MHQCTLGAVEISYLIHLAGPRSSSVECNFLSKGCEASVPTQRQTENASCALVMQPGSHSVCKATDTGLHRLVSDLVAHVRRLVSTIMFPNPSGLKTNFLMGVYIFMCVTVHLA